MIEKSGNFIWLILALMLLLIGIPIADEFDSISRAFARAFTFSCLLGIGALSLRHSDRLFRPAMALAVAGIVLNIAAVQTTTDWLTYASFTAIMLFLMIAIGVTFHDVATDDIDTRQSLQQSHRLPRRQAADLGCAGAGGVARVEAVDVEAEVGRPVADDPPCLGDHPGDAERLELLDEHHPHPGVE